MRAQMHTIAFRGIETIDVTVQIHIANGLPAMAIVGLADWRNRVNGYVRHGAIQPVSGVLPAAIAALAAGRELICPSACGSEAAWADGLSIIAPPSLTGLLNHIHGRQVLTPPIPQIQSLRTDLPDLVDLKGQDTARRVLEIAEAGGHHLLMVGPPGSGKSMLAARLAGLLPPLTPAEALEVTMMHSVAGHLGDGGLIQNRPFREPHHSASMAARVAAARQFGSVRRKDIMANAMISIDQLDKQIIMEKPAEELLRAAMDK
ncbi:MAG: ATP-binding protein, partial [Alphaproteobacteria bacterium]|nr:ATP-binding protein [Alphaproteobacteria bacterium]